MDVGSIPKATLGRIPIYIEYLRTLPDEEVNVSATKIARGLSLGEVQVRKDLAVISGAGRPRVGYERNKLIRDLEAHLGTEGITAAVLVGVGKLGRALLDHGGFEEFGVRIVAGFDCNESVIKISKSRSVLPIKDIESFVFENDVKIGIITVGQGSAQEVADRLVAAGIRAIWNFAPCQLTVPDGIILKQENLALSLAHLNSLLKRKK
ncbi:MAG: redox-sensing transcriptional repressor Rex [Clostridia bacterium]|nr:redox-sensing transcriptional repressor Rex [Clostridia bacterium]